MDVRRLAEVGGRRLPFLRWSFLRSVLGLRWMPWSWQVGDGREMALAEYVEANARRGDIDDVLWTIDDFAYRRSFLINIGDEKGEILDAAVQRAKPRLLLEVGAYCGYSALRMARTMPEEAVLVSVELSAANAAIARRVWQHAGVGHRVHALVGSLGDGGQTLARLESEYGFTAGALDFVFLDHGVDDYVPDLERMINKAWLRPGSVVVADNIRLPGAPEYRRYLREREGSAWRTVEHATHLEYQTLLKDVMTESVYLGDSCSEA
ncbi:O-methyltransferase [Haloechinothrix sp. LS1_15]|uniref:O-methyltransferase n=1 Tax=Haloechinothrix sp. LS1_15 TaxID=2652248 RepID=UPI00294AA751|nr:O-methyltransferase [Haloechinothrix sp. LS1_15]